MYFQKMFLTFLFFSFSQYGFAARAAETTNTIYCAGFLATTETEEEDWMLMTAAHIDAGAVGARYTEDYESSDISASASQPLQYNEVGCDNCLDEYRRFNKTLVSEHFWSSLSPPYSAPGCPALGWYGTFAGEYCTTMTRFSAGCSEM